MRQFTNDERTAMLEAYSASLPWPKGAGTTDGFQAGFAAGLEYTQVSSSETTPDSRADDLAMKWIVDHTKIELDSEPYRGLVRAFLQFGKLQAAEVDRLRAEVERLTVERAALARSSDYHIDKVAELDQEIQALRAENVVMRGTLNKVRDLLENVGYEGGPTHRAVCAALAEGGE